MLKKGVEQVVAGEALKYIKQVANQEEKFRDVPLVFPEAGTCYAFSSILDPNKKNDWRVDGYRWRHNGKTRVKVGSTIVIKTFYNVFSAPKISTPEFRRISYECDDYPHIVIVFYKGQHTVAGEFPHGNRRCDSKPFIRTCPSIIAACKNAAGDPSTIFNDMTVANGSNRASLESMISSPRDTLQIANVKKYMRRKQRFAQNAMHQMQEIVADVDFVYEIISNPDLLVVAYQEPQLVQFSSIFSKLPLADTQFLSFNTIYRIGELHISCIFYRHTLDSPSVPLLFLIYEHGVEITHEAIWTTTCERIPKLTSAKNVCLVTNDDASWLNRTAPLIKPDAFSGIVNQIQYWREDPQSAVWDLQNHAEQLYRLSCHYGDIGRKTGMKLKRRQKYIIEAHFYGSLKITDPSELKLFCAPDPEEVTQRVQKALVKAPNDAMENISARTGPTFTSIRRAKMLISKNAVSFDSSSGTFFVAADSEVRVVKLFPQPKCSCCDPSPCHHILACKYAIGMPWPTPSVPNSQKSTTPGCDAVPGTSKRPKLSDSAIVIEIISDHMDEFPHATTFYGDGCTDTNDNACTALEPPSPTCLDASGIGDVPRYMTRYDDCSSEASESMSIGNVIFTVKDLKTLDTDVCLSEKIIHAYLTFLQKLKLARKTGRMLVLPHLFTAKLKEKNYSLLYTKVCYGSFRWIFIPMCENEHWTLLVADVGKRQVFLLNPHGTNLSEKYCSLWSEYMARRSRSVEYTLNDWEEVVIAQSNERDIRDSGVFALMNAEAIVNNMDPTELKGEHIGACRKSIRRCLLGFYKHNECDAAICFKPERNEQLFCENCFLWFHADCGRVSSEQRERKYFCCFECQEAIKEYYQNWTI